MTELIENFIYLTIDEIKSYVPKAEKLKKTPDTVLFGEGSELDSLGLVSLLSALEGKVEEERNITITIANERAMSLRHSPFRTVESLAKFVQELIDEENNG